MSKLFQNIAGLGVAAYVGQAQRKADFKKDNELRLKRGLPELPWEDAPIDKAVGWAGDKFKSWAKPDAASSAMVSAPIGAPAGGSEDVGLWDRLKAGNIDAPGSEAYNRWGQGKADSDQRVAELDESSRLESEQALTDVPADVPTGAPASDLLAKGAAEGMNSTDQSDQFSKQQFDDASSASDAPMDLNRFGAVNTLL